jgi:hypothetical protein
MIRLAQMSATLMTNSMILARAATVSALTISVDIQCVIRLNHTVNATTFGAVAGRFVHAYHTL